MDLNLFVYVSIINMQSYDIFIIYFSDPVVCLIMISYTTGNN